MRRVFSLIISTLFSLILVSCQNKASVNNNSALNTEGTTEISEDFSDSLLPFESIVKERQTVDKAIIEKNSTEIQVYLLQHDYNLLKSYLKTEVVNQTEDTTYLTNDTFQSYDESNNSWETLRYPDNYFRTDITQFIPPGKAKQFQFFFPISASNHKGTYKLELIFHNTSYKSYYYVQKSFMVK